MKTLFIARHGKSDWSQPGLADHDRLLNQRGLSDASRMAEHLAGHYPPPQQVITSTAARATATANMLAAACGFAPADIVRDPQLYLAGAGTLLDVIHGLGAGFDSVMLVGHNPGFTDLVNRLCDAGLDNLPTCGVARIGFDIADWRGVTAGNGQLLSLDRPKGLNLSA